MSSLGIEMAIMSSRMTIGFRAGRGLAIFSTCQLASECRCAEKISFLSFTKVNLSPEGL